MNCESARPLIPLYLDGELTEPRASVLRPHLLECPNCRGVAQGAKALKTWFVPTEPVSIPDGFAARVARRALAGDRGFALESERAQASTGLAGEREETPILQFVLQAVAVAAVLLITLSIAIRLKLQWIDIALDQLQELRLRQKVEGLIQHVEYALIAQLADGSTKFSSVDLWTGHDFLSPHI